MLFSIHCGHFTNSSFGISPDISQVPPSIFPTTSLAFIVSLLSGGGYLHLGAYDGGPGDPDDPRGTHIILDGDDGIFCALEGGIQHDETHAGTGPQSSDPNSVAELTMTIPGST
jgi:porin